MEDRDIRGASARRRHLQHRRPPLPLVDGRLPGRADPGRSFHGALRGGDRTLPSRPASSTTSHKLLGLTILLLAGVRLIYRLAHGAPRRRADAPALGEGGEPRHALGDLRAAHRRAVARLARHLASIGPFEPFGIKLPALARTGRRRACACSSCTWSAAYALIVLLTACTSARRCSTTSSARTACCGACGCALVGCRSDGSAGGGSASVSVWPTTAPVCATARQAATVFCFDLVCLPRGSGKARQPAPQSAPRRQRPAARRCRPPARHSPPRRRPRSRRPAHPVPRPARSPCRAAGGHGRPRAGPRRPHAPASSAGRRRR